MLDNNISNFYNFIKPHPHRMRKMATIASVVAVAGVSVTHLRPARTAGRITVLFGVQIPWAQRTLLDAGPEGNVGHCTIYKYGCSNSYSSGSATVDVVIATLL